MIRIGARSSPLSRAQVAEVLSQLPPFEHEIIWVETFGDKDQKSSLRPLGKSDFFTRELDYMLLNREIDWAIHSAKDLPDPLPDGLKIACLTQGLDARDSLVLREGETLNSLPCGAWIATSSERREEAVRSLRNDLQFKDVRGTIHQRLHLLHTREADGVVIAEAALIRLQLTHLNRLFLPGPTSQGQGQLALVTRKKTLYLGLDPSRFSNAGDLIHYPIIKTVPIAKLPPDIESQWDQFTHVLFTSPSAVKHWFSLCTFPLVGKIVFAIGHATQQALQSHSVESIVSQKPTQEGIVSLLQQQNIGYLLWPRSSRSRNVVMDDLKTRKVCYMSFDLYDTMAQKIAPLPDLAEIDEIYFTSPSTVDAFEEIFGSIPKNKARAIGPVTAERLFAYR